MGVPPESCFPSVAPGRGVLASARTSPHRLNPLGLQVVLLWETHRGLAGRAPGHVW